MTESLEKIFEEKKKLHLQLGELAQQEMNALDRLHDIARPVYFIPPDVELTFLKTPKLEIEFKEGEGAGVKIFTSWHEGKMIVTLDMVQNSRVVRRNLSPEEMFTLFKFAADKANFEEVNQYVASKIRERYK